MEHGVYLTVGNMRS